MISKYPEDIAQLFVKVRQNLACSHGHLLVFYLNVYCPECPHEDTNVFPWADWTAKNVFAVRSWKGPNGVEPYWLIVQVFSGLGRYNQGLNPSGACRMSCASGPIHR